MYIILKRWKICTTLLVLVQTSCSGNQRDKPCETQPGLNGSQMKRDQHNHVETLLDTVSFYFGGGWRNCSSIISISFIDSLKLNLCYLKLENKLQNVTMEFCFQVWVD